MYIFTIPIAKVVSMGSVLSPAQISPAILAYPACFAACFEKIEKIMGKHHLVNHGYPLVIEHSIT